LWRNNKIDASKPKKRRFPWQFKSNQKTQTKLIIGYENDKIATASNWEERLGPQPVTKR